MTGHGMSCSRACESEVNPRVILDSDGVCRVKVIKSVIKVARFTGNNLERSPCSFLF